MTWLSSGICGGQVYSQPFQWQRLSNLSPWLYILGTNNQTFQGLWAVEFPFPYVALVSCWKCASKNLCGLWEVWCILLNNLLTLVCISYWVRLFRGKLLKPLQTPPILLWLRGQKREGWECQGFHHWFVVRPEAEKLGVSWSITWL